MDGKPSPGGCGGEDTPDNGAVSTQLVTVGSRVANGKGGWC